MRKLFPLLILLVFVAAGCGGSEVKLELPKDTPQATVDLINKVMPAIQAKCPGWSKYGNILQLEGISPNCEAFLNDTDTTKVTWVRFKVPNDADVPGEYRAHGHTLHVGIAEDGKLLVFMKDQSARIFMDENIDTDGRNIVVSLTN